jgi:hypothetical protein
MRELDVRAFLVLQARKDLIPLLSRAAKSQHRMCHVSSVASASFYDGAVSLSYGMQAPDICPRRRLVRGRARLLGPFAFAAGPFPGILATKGHHDADAVPTAKSRESLFMTNPRGLWPALSGGHDREAHQFRDRKSSSTCPVGPAELRVSVARVILARGAYAGFYCR